MSSRLFKALREAPNSQVSYGVSIDNSEYNSSGLFVIQTSTEKGNVEQTIKIILGELKNLCNDEQHKVTQEELEKAKKFLKGNLQLAYENPLTIASHNGNEILLNRQYLIPIRQVVRLLYGENLTTDIVNECAKRYFTPQRMSVFMVGAATKLEPIEQIFTGTFSKTSNISFKSFMKEEVRVLGQEDISKIEIEDISKIESPGTQGEAIFIRCQCGTNY